MKTPPHPSTSWFLASALTALGAFVGTNLAAYWWDLHVHPILAADAIVLGIASCLVCVTTGVVACKKRWWE